MSDSITCPKCNTTIPLSEAFSHEVEQRLRAEFDGEKERLEEQQAQLLADRDAENEAALARTREEAAAGAEARASEQVSVQMRDLESRVEEQEKLRREAEERELELRRQKRELESQKESLQLQMERQLDEERDAIAARATEQAEEKNRLLVRERELQIEAMQKEIEDLQAAAHPKRSGLQGEVLEREIEDVLRDEFPTDAIEPVKSGKRGADVVRRVRSSRGECGKLLWESKNHKHWSHGWIDKLRGDQQAEKAEVAIIVTAALPDGVEHIGFLRGVWVCDFAAVVPLATMLRQQLDRIAHRAGTAHRREPLPRRRRPLRVRLRPRSPALHDQYRRRRPDDGRRAGIRAGLVRAFVQQAREAAPAADPQPRRVLGRPPGNRGRRAPAGRGTRATERRGAGAARAGELRAGPDR